MRIESSDIALYSTHELVNHDQRNERLLAWVGERPEADPPVVLNLSPEARNQLGSPPRDSVQQSDLPETGRAETIPLPAVDQLEPTTGLVEKPDQIDEVEPLTKLSPQQQMELRIVESLLERITGKKVKLLPTVRIEGEKLKEKRLELEAKLHTVIGEKGADQKRAGWGLEYDSTQTRFEGESMTFLANGVVVTGNGQEVDLSAELRMSREFYERNELHVRAGDGVFTDPLVINFDGKGAELSTRKVKFDIDADGKDDQISRLADGSAFLALDKNGDGKVNDGSELFGPSTGNGFKELQIHDEDGDGWIDEDDSVFDKLRVWEVGENGMGHLVALGESGVGAIYLGRADTEFSMTDDENNPLGKLRDTGIFLGEDGGGGFVQELDLRTKKDAQ